MQNYEYAAVPAPRKGISSKGVKGVPARFANAVSVLMNEMAQEGWEYQRSDTLPCEERQGLTGKTIKYHAILIFRRALDSDADVTAPLSLPVPDEHEAPLEDSAEDVFETEPETVDEFPDEVSEQDPVNEEKT